MREEGGGHDAEDMGYDKPWRKDSAPRGMGSSMGSSGLLCARDVVISLSRDKVDLGCKPLAPRPSG